MLDELDRIHTDQQRRGRRPMSEEEMAAEIAAVRGEDNNYDQRWHEIWTKSAAKPEVP